jgi:nucleotide-binding universal stress UspA family protein
MTEQFAGPKAPERVLLATDLSHRCDRALDRAADLARRWRADLVIIHALERPVDAAAREQTGDPPAWQAPRDRPRLVERRLRRDLPTFDVLTSVVVEESRPADLVLRTAAAGASDLVVTGVARDRSFQSLLLGGTVQSLIREARNPLLVVKDRPRGAYGQIVVPVDFTDASKYALEFAATLFADAELTVFHGADAPYAGLMDNARYPEEMRQAAIADCHRFIESSRLAEDVRARVQVVVEVGAPGQLLGAWIGEADADLVVVGNHERARLVELVIGSTTQSIVDSVPCDVLIVRDPGADG